MRKLGGRFLALGLLLALAVVLMQAPEPGEAKKIKKVVKELKKLKKYAYLLAATRKKLYAIPFPMPLPVFVKRQHIYTQVPIIPRYVQRPQPYSAPAMPAESAVSYEIANAGYAHQSEYPKTSYAQPEHPKMSYAASSSSHQHYGMPKQRNKKQQAQSSSSSASSSSSSGNSNGPADLASQYLGSSSKYLAQIANLISQASPMLGTANKDLINKLLTGQARVLPPTALLAAIKSAGAAQLPMAPRPMGHEQRDPQDQEQEQDSKSHSHSGSSSASSSSYSSSASSPPPPQSSGGPVSYDEPASNASSSKPEPYGENRPSASEVYRSSMRYGPMRALYGPYLYPLQLQAAMMGGHAISPMAALAAASRAQAMAMRVPILRAPIPAGDMLPLMEAFDSANQIDSLAASGHEVQEMSASSPQDHESPAREYPNDYAALLKHRQQQLQQLQNHPDQLLAAVQKLHRQQALQARQQNAIKMALLREQDVAARLAESRHMLVRAHQLGLPLDLTDQASLIKQYRHHLAV